MSNQDKDANTLSPDELAKTKKKEDIELNEQQLAEASGGAFNAYLYLGNEHK